jgi:NYN domain
LTAQRGQARRACRAINAELRLLRNGKEEMLIAKKLLDTRAWWAGRDHAAFASKGWADTLSKHAIIPQQQFAYTTGKNASDITLVIDAMDLLHSGRFDGFCLVSSDSDFTRLAARIREQGVDVFGFGEQKTPESFRQACRRFVYTENLLTGASNSQDAASTSKPLQPPSAATPIIVKVITQM